MWIHFPDSEHGAGLSPNVTLAEVMGRSFMAPEAFNCSGADTSNMEVFVRYGTKEQKENGWNHY